MPYKIVCQVIFFLALSLALMPSFEAKSDDTVLNFGIISTESSQNLRKIWDPFLEDMRKGTGYDIKAFFASDYAGVIEAMRFDKAQLAWMGNKAAMEAVDRAGGEVFAQTVSIDGSEGYYSHLIAHVDSPLNNLEDVIEKAGELNFGNGDPNSTSGFLVPQYYAFALNDLDPKTAFKRVVNANHETNALTVANKQVDIATNNNENLARLEKTAPDKRKLVKVIWTSPIIPSDPLVWRKDLDPAIKERLVKFLLGYGQEGPDKDREKAILADLLWLGFKKSDDGQLLPIRQLELFKEQRTLMSDDKMERGEKDKRLSEIQRQLAEIAKKTE
jgi:phosphonate transport system substrate-binding protein